MRYWLTFLLAFAISAFSADVKPFYFSGVDADSQQVEWDYLMKYKMFGTNGIEFKGQNIVIPDKSGWFGTATGDWTMKNNKHFVGGPILIGGNVSFDDGQDTLSTGPVRVTGNLTTSNFNPTNAIEGISCVAGTVGQKYAAEVPSDKRYFGENYGACPPEVPDVKPTLAIPASTQAADSVKLPAVTVGNSGVVYIDIPPTDGKELYDLYIPSITFNNGGHLYFRMQNGGRLTRVFLQYGLNNFIAGNSIQVMYMDTTATFSDGSWTGDGAVINNTDYSGNLLFYTTADISFPAMNPGDTIQGTFMTTGTITVRQHMVLAGQLLANFISVDADFDGRGFLYVPFDPPVLNIDPTALASGKFQENNRDVKVPIHLDTLAKTDVYFSYCFILDDRVTQADFNVPVPACGSDTGKVHIPAGDSLPETDIYLNVFMDGLAEGDETLKFHIFDLQGAVMPGNVHSGNFNLTLADAGEFGLDTTWKYSEYENYTGEVDYIRVIGKSDSTRFFLDSAYAGRYAVDSITGMITLLTPVDYEQLLVDTLKVTLKDTSGLSFTGYIPVTVTDVNEAPEITTAEIKFSENLPIPAKIGTISWTDEDIVAAFRDNAVEVLVPADGITVQPDGSVYTTKVFDFETDPKEIELTVRVYDKTNPTLADTATVKFALTDVNESPSVKDTTFHVNENFAGTIGKFIAADPEGKTLTYTVTDSKFAIGTDGTLSNTTPFDYESTNRYTVTVKVSDGTMTSTAKITVIVDNVNEPVHARDTSFTIDEGMIGTVGQVSAYDEDGTAPAFSVSDTSRYTVNSLGNLSVKTPFDYSVTKSDTVLVFVTDGTFTDTARVIVNVGNVNEPPVLQPNDSLSVPENCTGCTVGQVIATDGDGDTLNYTIDDPRFEIDSTGKITTKEPVDYETEKEITVKVTVTDPSGAKDSLDYTIKVENVNEPVHVNDTTCSVRENYTGEVCTIPATDDDGTRPIYSVDDTTNYSIDSTGKLVIKNPIDFEEKPADTVTVIVTDGTLSDTAQVIIRVMDIPEKTTITEVDDKPKQDTIKTNDPDHKIDWEVCEGGVCKFDSLDVKVHGDTTITVCNEKKTSCDNVVILFNDAPPVVTLTNATSTTASIDYITIEEQKDEKIYVNKKDNPITVTVKDTVRKTEQKFEIEVKLDTLQSKKVHIEDYGYVLDEFAAVITPIGDGLAEMEQVVVTDGVAVTIKQIVDLGTNEPVEKVQTVSYTTKVDGKDVVVSYKVDPRTGKRQGDFKVSYMLDSCTSVSYTMDEKKRIVKNDEGNIGYTIGYEFVDDFGNKAFASVEIVYDDIPPVVEILSPVKSDVFKTNAVEVKWTVNGEVQDTLTLQRLEKGTNVITRRYVDKAGNEAVATVIVLMKEAKDIDVRIIHPVTEVDQAKVDEYYSNGKKYDEKKPFEVKIVDPKSDSVPDAIGVGFLVDIALPSVSPTGGMASLDDLVKNGQIPVDDEGNIVGASTKGIPVEQYVKEHCTAEFEEDYNQHGLNIPLYDIKYHLHLWVWTTTAGYVNDFMIEYKLNDQAVASEAGTVQMVIDWLADKNGSVNASNGHQLGTSSYITTLYSKSIAKHRCDYKEQRKGEKTVKKQETTKVFGYKRPKK